MSVEQKTQLQSETNSQPTSNSRSKVDLSNRRFTSLQYGLISPFYNAESIPGDKLHFTSKHNIRSGSLKSPLMSDVFMSKDFFAIPMEAIIPNAWPRIITNPTVGDDMTKLGHIPSLTMKQLNPLGVANLKNSLILGFRNCFNLTKVDPVDATSGFGPIAYILYHLNNLSYLYSRGSLLARLNINVWTNLDYVTAKSKDGTTLNLVFDDFYDYIISNLRSWIIDSKARFIQLRVANLSSDGKSVVYTNKIFGNADVPLSSTTWIDEALDFCKEHFVTHFNFPTKVGESYIIGDKLGFAKESNEWPLDFMAYVQGNSNVASLNLSALAAYQIVCAHYFTNDKIDDIYSAQLYRDMMWDLAFHGTSTSENSYTYNGVSYLYDGLSSKALSRCIDLMYGAVLTDSPSVNDLRHAFYRINFFGFNRSLKYQDYFTGARVRPLGIGDTDVNVVSDKVSVIDTTRAIQMQRFLNLVNKTGRKFEEYTGKLFGTYVAPDYHNPSYLGRIRDKIITYETENTADAQQTKAFSVTASFSSNGNNYAFDFDSDRFQIVLGVVSFDIPRVYCRTIDRSCFHFDRFEFFNPKMQFIGDQPIYELELSATNQSSTDDVSPLAFGYQVRHAEYKTSYPTASGAFLVRSALPNWQFLADFEHSFYSEHVDSEYIRSKVSELDNFYIHMFGYSPATRYHFICDFQNDVTASRPLIVNPNILQ